MKKEYCSPEWELVLFAEDIVTASGNYKFDPDGFIEDSGSGADDWDW